MTIQQFSESERYDTITLDKTELLQAYIELDKLYNRSDGKHWDLMSMIYRHIAKATGYQFNRILEKKENDFKG